VDPRFPLVVVDVSEEDADDAAGELFELGARGVEERDATTLVRGAPGLVTLVASFETLEAALEAAREARDALGRGARVEEIVGDAWRDEWKKHFHEFELVPGVAIAPPWEVREEAHAEAATAAARSLLVLEPGRAFGTGLHETTALVARVLYDHRDELAGKIVLDVGCGSGILALVAIVLGVERARAVDVDPEAVAVTRENAERNGLSARVEVDTTGVESLAGRYPAVVANIEANVLVPLAPALMARVAARGLLVLSGILASQAESVRAAYAPFDLEEAPVKGEWTALVLRGPS
jgi:ribosomal protein L11 methyltransferase